MKPESRFSLFLKKLKCFLGLHDWVVFEEDPLQEFYCYSCGKYRDRKAIHPDYIY